MINSFQELSNQTVNKFIQSVVFIDDKAYQDSDPEDGRHDFNASEITRNFAKDRKICSIFRPETEDDIQLFSDIACKADITVLDWQLIIDENPEVEAVADDDEDEDDVRGLYTKAIIRSMLSTAESRNSLKLILIYTGETDLAGIASDVLGDLTSNDIHSFVADPDDECCVKSGCCKILVRAKSNGGTDRGKHSPLLRTKNITYEDLPRFINDEFSKITNGLLPNFTLEALTVIRENFYQILNLFSNRLDAAYLTHKALLPNIEDANELLIEILGDTFVSILRAHDLNKKITPEIISLWLDEFVESEKRNVLDKSGVPREGEKYTRNPDLLKKLLVSSTDVKDKFKQVLSAEGISNNTLDKTHKLYAFNLFHNVEVADESNADFARLCQQKDLIKVQNYSPSLTLGTVVRSTTEQRKYYVCIQQRCDSVRLYSDDERRFLFISLKEVNSESNFEFVAPDGTRLKVDKDSFNIRTVKFKGSDDGTVNTGSREGKYYIPTHYATETPEMFEFIFELKELYAQKIVANFSSKLSRVGVDEPEWVRLS